MAALLKDLYNHDYIILLSTNILKYYPDFNQEAFIKDVFDDAWDTKELKKRMRHISTLLGIHLPMEYPHVTLLLKQVFTQMNHAYGLENMIFQDFVEVYGLEDFHNSMSALEHFTIGSSSEFAIRQFILMYEDATMKQMKLWAKSENEHIRRLASEGCRPRLPWAIALPKYKQDPSPVLEILEILKDDPSAYVRKSVANNLNDISKDNPEILKSILKRWIGSSKESEMILKHGCRTLLKSADKEVLQHFGLSKPSHVRLTNFSYDTKVVMGDELNFSFELSSKKKLKVLRVEYALYFLRKNNQHNKKVFKISEADYESKTKSFTKSHSFKPITTRNYYSGEQKLAIIINGVLFKEVSFTLL